VCLPCVLVISKPEPANWKHHTYFTRVVQSCTVPENIMHLNLQHSCNNCFKHMYTDKITYMRLTAGVGEAVPLYQLCYRLDGSEFEFRSGQKIFSSPTTSKWILSPIQHLCQQMQGFLPRGTAADLSPPSSAEVENEWSYICTSICSSMACTGQLYLYVISCYSSAQHNDCSSCHIMHPAVESQCSH